MHKVLVGTVGLVRQSLAAYWRDYEKNEDYIDLLELSGSLSGVMKWVIGMERWNEGKSSGQFKITDEYNY